MIKAIIFDCFGVLTEDGWLAFLRQHFPEGSEAREEALSLNHQVDAGLIGYEDHLEEVARLSGETKQAVRGALETTVPNEQLLRFIATDLKPHYKIGLLSNVSGDWLQRLFTDEQIALFDATALSYELGVTKPHPRAYQTIVQRLGIEPQEAIFTDDQERYVTGAKEQGIHGIVFQNTAQFTRDLSETLEQG